MPKLHTLLTITCPQDGAEIGPFIDQIDGNKDNTICPVCRFNLTMGGITASVRAIALVPATEANTAVE